MSILEIEFVIPSEEDGYKLFPDKFENNPNVVFHGTSEGCANSIKKNRFRPMGKLPSTSFTKNSAVPLGYACSKRSNGGRGAVIAIKFDNLNVRGIRQEGDVVYLDNYQIEYEMIAVCYIPSKYVFR